MNYFINSHVESLPTWGFKCSWDKVIGIIPDCNFHILIPTLLSCGLRANFHEHRLKLEQEFRNSSKTDSPILYA